MHVERLEQVELQGFASRPGEQAGVRGRGDLEAFDHAEIAPAGVEIETDFAPFFKAAIDDPETVARLSAGFELLEPEDVAAAMLYALDTPRRVHVATVEPIVAEQATKAGPNRRIGRRYDSTGS